jgi:hypothetical protein
MNEFNIFISQSTGKSRDIAEVVAVWLREDMQLGNPWIASSNIEGGENSREAINKALQEARIGIIFLTTDNVANQWIFYEIGFLLARGITIFPYVIDLERLSDLPAPINHLQGKRVNKNGTKDLVIAINKALGSPISVEVLLKKFNSKWKKLDTSLKPILEPSVDDYNSIIDDFIELFLAVNKYRASLNFSAYADEAVRLVKKQKSLIVGQNNKNKEEIVKNAIVDKIVESAYKEIEDKRKLFINKESNLVGNVSNFIQEYFTVEDLQKIVTRLVKILWSHPRRELERHIKIEESAVYLHYHQKLLDKLRERIVRK